ncbi:IclR family transcriptional regulator [Actinoallomurus iriomotensis]|uniref:Transcriptional regulator n=1 Tax=Actinoallomurus iriomotensis TaxID=478107 RepID=A0A9W6SAN2_9ACTN|nr:helix-turn-helix domain-containing protein [Actinoallomurus iriomotensis]GLY88870.1 transcriptional regulator [Actinoallomurus iriomotensis]
MTEPGTADGEGRTRRVETSLTLSRGLSLLELLAGSPEGRTLTELAGELGLSRPAVYRLVATLIDHHLVRRTRDGTFSVALGVLALTRHVLPALGEASREVLQRLAEETGATAHLAVAEGAESVAVAVVEPRTADFHLAYRVGSRLPVEQGALGRAILAGRQGRFEVLSSTGEIIPGATGVAVPLIGLGSPAALGVVAPHPLDVDAVSPALVDAAQRLRRAFGSGE